jgi:hypothetical protein
VSGIQRPVPERALDWSPADARAFGEQALDIWTELLDRLHDDLPVARDRTAAEVRDALARDIPANPMPIDELVAHLREIVFNESMYPGHPGFVAYISGAGTVPGAAADLIAAGLNQNTGGWRLSPAATEIEQHLVKWFARRLGMPDGSTGYITSGGAMTNLIGLTLARSQHAGWDVRADGMRAGPQLTVYMSSEVHDTIDRAAQMLGIGDAGVRHVGTDDGLRMDVAALRAAIDADLAVGLRPIAVVGSAGTVGTGAIDPLTSIADVCAEYGLGSTSTPPMEVRRRLPISSGLSSMALSAQTRWGSTLTSGFTHRTLERACWCANPHTWRKPSPLRRHTSSPMTTTPVGDSTSTSSALISLGPSPR